MKYPKVSPWVTVNPVRNLMKHYYPATVRNALDCALKMHNMGWTRTPRHCSLRNVLGTLPRPVLETTLQLASNGQTGKQLFKSLLKKWG